MTSRRSRPRPHAHFALGTDGDETEQESDVEGMEMPPKIVVESARKVGGGTEEGEKERGNAFSEEDGPPAALGAPRVGVEDLKNSNGHPATTDGPAKNAEEKQADEYPPPPSTPHSRSREPPTLPPEPTKATAPADAPSSRFAKILLPLPEPLQWIEPHLNWKGWRPVVRASVAAWCGLILLLDSRSQAALGQAAFLVLIVSTISPASLPVAAMLETTFFQIILVLLGWAWSCIAIAIAHASRTEFKLTQAQFNALAAEKLAGSGLSGAALSRAIQEDIFSGAYLESSSSAVCAAFLGVGCGFLLWLRGHLGPGPALFGVIFSVIMVVISLTIACLFPYPYYSLGLIFFAPFAAQKAITVVTTFLIFPETTAHEFADRLVATLRPLQTVIQLQQGMLDANPRTSEWLEFKSIKAKTLVAMGGVALMGASEANLNREITYARVSGKDLTKILNNMRILVTRTTGFVRFHDLVEQHLHREAAEGKGGAVANDLVIHLGHSRLNSREHTPSSTRPPSPSRSPHRKLDISESHEVRSKDATAANPDALSRALSDAVLNAHRHAEATHSPLAPTPLSPTPTRSAHRHGHSASGLDSAQPSRNSSTGSLADLAEDSAARPSAHRASTEIDLGHHRHHHERHHHSHSHPHSRRRSRSRHRHHGSSHISLPSLLQGVFDKVEVPRPVGLMESQRYMDLEDYLHNPRDEQHIEEIIELLSSASRDLITTLDKSVGHLIDVVHRLKATERTWRARILGDDLAQHDRAVARSQKQLEELEAAFHAYRDVRRLEVVTPFAGLFDPFSTVQEGEAAARELASPSHRGLFWCFSYQASLLAWAEALIEVYKGTIKVEKKRRSPRLWLPTWSKYQFGNPHEEAVFEDENPDALEKLNSHSFSAPRNPDFRPPKANSQVVGIAVYNTIHIFSRKDVLFGLKLSIVLALVSMPAYFASTCYFFYRERGVWVLIMVALTSTQYVGDTTFGFVVRIVGTFFGAILGLLMWSIAAQTGPGSPYAVAAVSAVFLPLIMFYRVHYTPVITAIIPAVTTMLVVGYSWQNAHQPSLSSVGYGWDIAWRRFVCVCIGITVAFLTAYLPPKVTQKGSVRRTYSKVIAQIGYLTCQVLSFANLKEDRAKAPRAIIKSITTLRTKVGKASARKVMIKWEPSLRGPWPEEHYTSLQSLQMELLDLTGQLLGVFASLDRKWTRALLQRSQLSNPEFLGDLLMAFQLISTALEHGTPLPMIYNPLLERFLKTPETREAHRPYGFDVVLGGENEEIDGLPTHVTLETICSLDYLRFSTGISQCYGIVNRIDRLMFVTKSLVGEAYLVYGIAEPRHRREEAEEEEERRWLVGQESRRDSLESMV